VTHYAGAARRAGRTVLLEAGRIAAVESPV